LGISVADFTPEDEISLWLLESLLCVFHCSCGTGNPNLESNFGIFLIFSGLIFFIGAFGIAFNRKNILILMASVEIMFLGVNLVFISGYIFLNLEVGLIYALISLSISAAEAAIGFGLLMSSFRNKPNITFSRFNRLKG
jgi:NADH:ubiquinone oxidoreductase subunit K